MITEHLYYIYKHKINNTVIYLHNALINELSIYEENNIKSSLFEITIMCNKFKLSNLHNQNYLQQEVEKSLLIEALF